jgi:hypothetical protein
LRQFCGTPELGARFFQAPEPLEKSRTGARQKMIAGESRFRAQCIDERKTRVRAPRHSDRYRAVQPHDRARQDRHELGENSSETQSVFAEAEAHEVVARGHDTEDFSLPLTSTEKYSVLSLGAG